MTVKTGVTLKQYTQQINEDIAKKQDKLIAGSYITIDENNVISADYDPVSVYELNFNTSDWDDSGNMVIAAATHQCGTTPILQYIQVLDNGLYYNVFVDCGMDANGNVTLHSNTAFAGRLLLNSNYANAANLAAITQNILTGSV